MRCSFGISSACFHVCGQVLWVASSESRPLVSLFEDKDIRVAFLESRLLIYLFEDESLCMASSESRLLVSFFEDKSFALSLQSLAPVRPLESAHETAAPHSLQILTHCRTGPL